MKPEVTFNDFKDQNHIAYDTSLYTMSMHTKNQVTNTHTQTHRQTDTLQFYIYRYIINTFIYIYCIR